MVAGNIQDLPPPPRLGVVAGEKATTPPPRAAAGIDDILLKAPRNLNEPSAAAFPASGRSWFRRVR